VQEALIQVLAASQRKERDYEDAVRPAWAEEWRRRKPEDWLAAKRIVDAEPPPAKKIPKGKER
jgi:hypothetical protein